MMKNIDVDVFTDTLNPFAFSFYLFVAFCCIFVFTAVAVVVFNVVIFTIVAIFKNVRCFSALREQKGSFISSQTFIRSRTPANSYRVLLHCCSQ